jgi:hypothetical protein
MLISLPAAINSITGQPDKWFKKGLALEAGKYFLLIIQECICW